MVREPADRQLLELPAAMGPAVGAREPPAAGVEAEQLLQELERRDRPARPRAPRPPARGRLTQPGLVPPATPAPGGAGAGLRELAVDDRRRGDQPAALALVLRRQPAGLVGLVAQGPARHARQHAAALVLVAVGARVAPPQRGVERAV